MRIFVTGASGYIGQALCEQAIAQGHSVIGLVRSRESYLKVESAGVQPLLGNLGNTEELERVAREVDAVFHLAFNHEWNVPYQTKLAEDSSAVEGLARGLAGSGKPLIVTSATVVSEPSSSGDETDEWAPTSDTFILKDRIQSERRALALNSQALRVSAIRLPAYVYGRGGSTFVPLLMEAAAKNDVSVYIGDGTRRTSAVHVDDAARCYLLAAERAPGGEAYNCASETGTTNRQLAEAIGAALNVPTRSVTRAEAEEFWGSFLTSFVDFENRPSSARARSELGWEPRAPLGLLEDIQRGSYRDLAERLRTQFRDGERLHKGATH